MKSYTSFAGAKRAAKGRPIVRLLADPVELWVVVPNLDTQIMIYASDKPRYEPQSSVGSTNCREIIAEPKRW